MIGATGSVLLVFAACLGAGAVVLRLLRVLDTLPHGERFMWSFAVGFGTVGWLLFFLAVFGRISDVDLFVFCVTASAGTILLRRKLPEKNSFGALDFNGLFLCAALLVVLVFDLFEGLSPPADADTLAYHFALPKQFLEAGRLEFVPRAGDGAAPLLLHMTYLLALGLGGELALTLWTMLSGWMAGGLMFIVCRRHLNVNWSLAATLVFLSTPAVLYGAGTGQVEVRIALFVLVAAAATAEGIRTGRAGYIALAGLMVGFYAGAKFMGLLFSVACALPFILRKRWFSTCAVYGLAVLLAGTQWYFWNWYNSGDPVFPVLFNVLNLPDSDIWNKAHDAVYRTTFFGAENPLPRSPYWFVAFPFHATLGITQTIEATRTGFGPFGLFVLPFAIGGLWQFRHRLISSPLLPFVIIASAFYTIWFFSGTSQRIRHLLPVYPLLLICLTAAATRWATRKSLRTPLIAAAGIAITIQLGGQMIFGAGYTRHVLSGESRESFLRRNVSAFAPVPWLNKHIGRDKRILVIHRQLVYLIEAPLYYAHPINQIKVPLYAAAQNPGDFLRALKSVGITHLLLPPVEAGRNSGRRDGRDRFNLKYLQDRRCLQRIRTFPVSRFTSRTLPAWNENRSTLALYALRIEGCRP